MVGVMPVTIIPKLCNGALSKCDEEEIPEQVYVGARIKSGEDFGTVKYIGEVMGYKGLWYGVEWDNELRGKHDGCVEGIRYFQTVHPSSGSFIRANKIAPFRTCAEAIKKCYGDVEDEITAAHRKTLINEWKREMGAPFIEMVGFEKIHQKQKFDKLLEVCVCNENVSKAGDVGSLCPNVRSLDVSCNLFSNWREVIQIAAQLPDLTELNVSKNRMTIDLSDDKLTQNSLHFLNLEKLNISTCHYEWTDILKLSKLWPNIIEIYAACNRIREFSSPSNTMRNLTILLLDGNPIDSWGEVTKLGHVKSLKVLSLNDCLIESIRFDDEVKDRKLDVFENLEELFLKRNLINDWRSIGELNKLKRLKKLFFLKNPIQSTEDYDTASQLVIAKIGNLQELNGTVITREERRGAEYDYLKRYGAEWQIACLHPEKQHSFVLEHGRFTELIEKYGLPEDSLLVRESVKTNLQSQMIEITLRGENGKSTVKKVPRTMLVQKLVALAQRLFPRNGNTGSATLYVAQDGRAEFCLDNGMRELGFYSIRNGDNIVVRYR